MLHPLNETFTSTTFFVKKINGDLQQQRLRLAVTQKTHQNDTGVQPPPQPLLLLLLPHLLSSR